MNQLVNYYVYVMSCLDNVNCLNLITSIIISPLVSFSEKLASVLHYQTDEDQKLVWKTKMRYAIQ